MTDDEAGMICIPTNHLRVLIEDDWHETGSDSYYSPRRKLQQMWVSTECDYQEWRDVPEVQE